ncbi:MAG TPA: alpha/beta fold hydrolase [Beijerinckiaceae bacterium]|nr:alpha/beta fold hydrolase [Beijerinckiaceae bacterium]
MSGTAYRIRLGPRIAAKLAGSIVALLLAASLSGCGGTLADVSGTIVTGGGLFASGPNRPSLPIPIFVASTRPDREERTAGGGAHFSLDIVSVPPGHKTGIIEAPTFGAPQEGRDFVLTSHRALDHDAFGNQIAASISGRIGSNRDVLLYVHGFNTSLQDARFRLAQIVADARFGGVPVLFTWPAENGLFSYVSAKERATASRDALEHLLWDLAQEPGVGRVHVLAHSMGTWLAMEALRENAIAGHADLGGKLGNIMLAAPDIDLAVFREQMARLGEAAHVSIFVSAGDRALSLSSRLAGDGPRVGALDPRNPRDHAELVKLGVKVYDLSSFADGLIGHDAFADSPQVIRTIGAHLAEPRKEDAKAVAVTDAGGNSQSDAAAPSAPITTEPLPPPVLSAPPREPASGG